MIPKVLLAVSRRSSGLAKDPRLVDGPRPALCGGRISSYGIVLSAAALIASVALSTTLTQGNAVRDWAEASDGKAGSGIIIRDECTDIRIPETWMTSPVKAGDRDVLESYESLREYLETTGEQDLWYLIVFDGYQADGGVLTRMMVRQPYEHLEHFEEFREAISAVQGRSARSTTRVTATTRILPIPHDLSQYSPQEVHAVLERADLMGKW